MNSNISTGRDKLQIWILEVFVKSLQKLFKVGPAIKPVIVHRVPDRSDFSSPIPTPKHVWGPKKAASLIWTKSESFSINVGKPWATHIN
jgi:hypothetical protein